MNIAQSSSFSAISAMPIGLAGAGAAKAILARDTNAGLAASPPVQIRQPRTEQVHLHGVAAPLRVEGAGQWCCECACRIASEGA